MLCRSRWPDPVPVTGLLCFEQNVLHIILFAVAIRPALNQKRFCPQELIRNFSSNNPAFQKCDCRMINHLNFQIA
jgi:hypothetical protein